ncbi:MAG: hypothetical protein JSW23_07840 [Planctomycetota bacterium]|nr:MAG: hypothetical protein JSW23_07840 [Planctomycetota bacterium]
MAGTVMKLEDKVNKAALRIATPAGFFLGVVVFIAVRNKLSDVWYRVPLSLLAGAFYFGVGFGAVMGVYKICRWVARGFYAKEEWPEWSNRRVNVRWGCRRIAIVLTVAIATSCALFGGSIPYEQYRTARRNLRILQEQGEEYKGKAYHDYTGRLRAEDNYWLNLPKGQLVALCLLGGVWGGMIGCGVVWLGYRFTEQFIVNLYRDKTDRKGKKVVNFKGRSGRYGGSQGS